MKKVLSTIITVLLVVSLTACGSSPSGDIKKPSDVPANNPASAEPEPSKEQAPAKEQEVEISETVLVDEAGVKITAKSLDTDGLFGAEVKLLIENNSGKDLTFQCRNASVNGYMVETMMSVEVVDGKKANDGLTFMSSDLETCGISEIADMEFSFHIFTTEHWETYLDTPRISLKTTISDTYEYTFDDSGNLVYDGNDVKVVVKGLASDSSSLGPSIVVYIENNGDRNVTVQARDVSVNGFMVDPIFSSDVVSGKHAVDTITFMASELEENEITAIETAELSFHIFESEGWETIVDTDTVSIDF